jgi:hypothetical protein
METLLWRAIETSCNAVEKNHTVAISFSTDPSFPGIWVTMEKLKDQALDDLFGSNEDFVLLKYLGVTVDTHVKDRCFGLIWPEHI